MRSADDHHDQDGDAGARVRRWWGVLPALLLALAGWLAYGGVIGSGYVFDDVPAIADNVALQRLDWWHAAFGSDHQPLANRPLACLSLGLDLALWGHGPRGPHLGNLFWHCVNAWLLFLLTRRALLAPNLARGFDRRRAGRCAFAVALLWVVHPLGADAVAYAVQRSTLLASGALLLTLYAALRAATSERPRRWQVLAAIAMALGMASKEDLVLGPVLVALFLRAVALPTWRALAAQRGFLLALASSWVVLAAAVWLGPHNPTVGYDTRSAVSGWQWLLTQAGVVLRYLALIVWPSPLRGAYGLDIVEHLGEALLPGVAVLLLLALTLSLWRRRPWWGWLGALFFLWLAPTSTVLPIVTEIAAERRVYLPMLAVLVPLVLALDGVARRRRAWGRIVGVAGVVAVGASIAALRARVVVYGDEATFWADAYHKLDPGSRSFLAGMILANHGFHLWAAGRADESCACLDRAMTCRTPTPNSYAFYAQSLLARGRSAEAVALMRDVVRDDPSPTTWGALGVSLAVQLGEEHPGPDDPRLDEAVAMLRRAAAARPQDELTWRALGHVLRSKGDLVGAEGALRRVNELNPRMAVFFVERAELLVALGRAAEIDGVTADLLAALPGDAVLRTELARVHANAGRLPRARALLQEALRIEPANAAAKALLAQVEADAARTR